MISFLLAAASDGPVTTQVRATPVMCSTFLPTGSLSEQLDVWLEALAGSPGRQALPDLSGASLVLLDLQRLFVDPSSPAYLPGWAAVAPRCQALLAAFRAAGRPVMFTRHVNPLGDDTGVIALFGGRPLRSEDPLAALDPRWQPLGEEPVVHKQRYSPWLCEGLAARVPPGGTLVIAGVTTHRCALATAVEAASRDRVPVLVADACATRSAELHLAALRCVANGFGFVATTREVTHGLRAV